MGGRFFFVTLRLLLIIRLHCGLLVRFNYYLDMGIKFLNVNVDSIFVLTCLPSSGNLTPEMFPIISLCRMLLSSELVVHLHHIYCEANSIADGLTKQGRTQASFLETFTDCPSLVFCKYAWDFLCIRIHVSALQFL